MQLYDYQQAAIDRTSDRNRVAFYHDMGLGKTFTGAEKLMRIGARLNLVVCQKSKIEDWYEHFLKCSCSVYDLTDEKELDEFINYDLDSLAIGVINYDLLWRREQLLRLENFTLMLDESSLIQVATTNRTKFIMKMKPKNVILLSGTPTGGRYERLLTQMNLLGWNISEKVFWQQYVNWEWNETDDGFWQKKILGYKNEERLKRKMRQYGCDFLKTEEVINLPEQIIQTIKVPVTKEYLTFKKHSYLEAYGTEFIGDTILTQMLYERVLCGRHNLDKLSAFQDLLRSTEDRLIVFYNFTDELGKLKKFVSSEDKPISIVNGFTKDLNAYQQDDDSVTFVQYAAGAMGLNLQKANKMIFFSPPLSSELFEQAKKRIHRVGQKNCCFYYQLVCKGSIEEKIYATLAKRRDYTEKLFEEDK